MIFVFIDIFYTFYWVTNVQVIYPHNCLSDTKYIIYPYKNKIYNTTNSIMLGKSFVKFNALFVLSANNALNRFI